MFLKNAALALFSPDYRSLRLPYASRTLVLGDAVVNVPRLIAFGASIALAVVLWLFSPSPSPTARRCSSTAP